MEQSTKLYIHYDLLEGKHFIPVEQSIATDQAIQKIVKNLSHNLFEGDIDFRVFVEAEDEGGVVKQFIIWATLGTLAISSNVLLKSLTGKNYAGHIENITLQMQEATINFLSKPSLDLVEQGFCKDDFYEAYEAKNLFYKTATANSNVLALGFCKEHNFPIERASFPYKTIELRREKESNDYVDKYHHLIVVAPINSEADKHLKWKVKDINTMEGFSVSMGDEDFYEIYFSNSLMVKEFKVRVRYYISTDSYGEQKIDDKKIILVYEYNKVNKLMSIPSNAIFEPAPFILPEKYKQVKNQTNLNI